jgi:hypothetical protein
MNGFSCAKVFLAEKTIASEVFMKLRDRISPKFCNCLFRRIKKRNPEKKSTACELV